MQRLFTIPIHVAGTLAANINFRWKTPFDCQLVHVSAVGSNANDATLTIGDSADNDKYLLASSVGDSNTPAEFDRDDLQNGDAILDQFPHLSKGDVLVVSVDFDGAAGTAVQNLTVVLTMTEG